MKQMLVWDTAVCRWFETVYLWMFDWTGITVGFLVFLCGVLTQSPVLVSEPGIGSIMNYFFVLIYALLGGMMHWRQTQEMHEVFNIEAQMHENNDAGFRIIFGPIFVVVGSFISIYLRENTIINIIGCFAVVGYLYLITVKIRDRQKKEFKIKVLKPAYAGNRS